MFGDGRWCEAKLIRYELDAPENRKQGSCTALLFAQRHRLPNCWRVLSREQVALSVGIAVGDERPASENERTPQLDGQVRTRAEGAAALEEASCAIDEAAALAPAGCVRFSVDETPLGVEHGVRTLGAAAEGSTEAQCRDDVT
jgi:hypothetical protein